MTGRQRHLVDFGRIPSRDNMAATVGIVREAVNHLRDLVDPLDFAFWSR